MFMEILQPQGDPFAEPQVLAMSHLVKSGVLNELADKISYLLEQYKLLLAQKEHGKDCQKELEEQTSRLKVFIHRFLLFWSVITKYCAEQLAQTYPSSKLAGLVDSVVAAVDPDCKDKYLQVEYVKFLRALVCSNEDNVNTAFMQARHFLKVINLVSRKDNMLSAQVNAVFGELKKLQCFKLHQVFVETHKDLFDNLKDRNPFLESLINHNRKARRSLRKSSQMDDEKASASAKLSDRGSDKIDGPGLNSPASSNLDSPFAVETESVEIKNMLTMLMNKKAKSTDEEDEDGHDIFAGLGHPIRNFSQSPIKQKSPEKLSVSSEDGDKKSAITIELSISLGKKDFDDDDDEEFSEENGKPTKHLVTE